MTCVLHWHKHMTLMSAKCLSVMAQMKYWRLYLPVSS
ncbi:hypothetical protein MGSAQ_001612 [marine sediment metagenome]|uniref:Uncharacterized protein n=1 Tax=marine sediment metagenome TaxID=412755 RepID=A0A1B6NVA4_9ZZZZ